MKLGLVSDTHGHLENLKKAVRWFREHGVEAVIHCGDVTRLEHLVPLLELGVPVHLARGNMDRRPEAFEAQDNGQGLRYHGDRGWLEIDGTRIGFTHGHLDSMMRQLKQKQPAYLIHGHTHARRDDRLKGIRVINPGSVKPPGASVAVLDTETDELEFLDLSSASGS